MPQLELRLNAAGDARLRGADQPLHGYETIATIDLPDGPTRLILGSRALRNQLLAVFKAAYETGQTNLALATHPVALQAAPAVAAAAIEARNRWLAANRQPAAPVGQGETVEAEDTN